MIIASTKDVGVLSKLKQLFGSSGKKGKKRVARSNIKKRFDLIAKTGQGSMSRVYRAQDRKTGKTVCLKVLDKVKTARFEARFLGLERPNEGEICMVLKHENVVLTFEAGMTLEGEQFLVMELVDGVGLNYLIETRSPSLEGHRIDFLAQAAEGLAYVHEQRFLHRDICPRNIMVTREGVVKLIDFGLSIPYNAIFCRPGNRTGTPNYLAPELIKRTTTDHRIDMFALGVTAYEVYTGNLPWEKTESLATIMSHMNRPGIDPRQFRPKLDEPTAKFLIRAIERDPKDRFQTAGEFRDALKRLPKA